MKHRLAAVCLGLAAFSIGASAAPVTYYFSGTFTTAVDNGQVLQDWLGAQYTGSFTYDPDAAVWPASNAVSRWTALDAGGLQAAVAGGSATSAANPFGVAQQWGVSVAIGPEPGFGDVFSGSGALAGTSGKMSLFTGGNMSLVLLDENGDAGFGSSGSLAPTDLNLALMEQTSFSIGGPNLFGPEANGALTCLSSSAPACGVAPVDEPPTLALLPLGAVGLWAARRKRARSGTAA